MDGIKSEYWLELNWKRFPGGVEIWNLISQKAYMLPHEGINNIAIWLQVTSYNAFSSQTRIVFGLKCYPVMLSKDKWTMIQDMQIIGLTPDWQQACCSTITNERPSSLTRLCKRKYIRCNCNSTCEIKGRLLNEVLIYMNTHSTSVDLSWLRNVYASVRHVIHGL